MHESKGQHIGKVPSLHTAVKQCMGGLPKMQHKFTTFTGSLWLQPRLFSGHFLLPRGLRMRQNPAVCLIDIATSISKVKKLASMTISCSVKKIQGWGFGNINVDLCFHNVPTWFAYFLACHSYILLHLMFSFFKSCLIWQDHQGDKRQSKEQSQFNSIAFVRKTRKINRE